jgi:hypothetical protein
MPGNGLNKISTTQVLNEFSGEYYREIVIDGKLLGDLLHESYPDANLSGLVPTLLSWLDNEQERRVTWERIIPEVNQNKISPVLMCGEDLDFWCTIVVADSFATSNIITWARIGIDDTDDRGLHPDHLGQRVNWLAHTGPYIFDRQEFVDCIEQFRSELK